MSYSLTVGRDFDYIPDTVYGDFGELPMFCAHRKYNFGSRHTFDQSDCNLMADIRKKLEVECGAIYMEPVFMYEHGEIQLSLTPFSCPFDSGQLGFIYITRDILEEDYGRKRLTAKLKIVIKARMADELETYTSIINGDYWYYSITNKDKGTEVEAVHGCAGFATAYHLGKLSLKGL